MKLVELARLSRLARLAKSGEVPAVTWLTNYLQAGDEMLDTRRRASEVTNRLSDFSPSTQAAFLEHARALLSRSAGLHDELIAADIELGRSVESMLEDILR